MKKIILSVLFILMVATIFVTSVSQQNHAHLLGNDNYSGDLEEPNGLVDC